MSATRAPSSSSLLHLLNHHHQFILRSSIRTHPCVWRVQSAGRPIAISALGHGGGIGCRGINTSSPRNVSSGLPPLGTEPYLNFLLPKDKTNGRSKSTQSEPSKGRRGFFGLRSKEPPIPDASSPRYLDGNNNESILGRHLGQKSNDLVLRCTEFDHEGNVTVVNGEFKKPELCTKHGLLPRDLRKLDSSIIVPHILVRKSSILVNLLHIRALIKADTVLVFDVYGSTDSYTQSIFMYDLEGKLRQGSKAMGGLPYEMRALEAILISVTAALESEMKVLQELVVGILGELEEDIDRDKLRNLLIYSKKLSTFEQKAKLIRDAIDEILEADDDLADMYLTEKAKGIVRPSEEHSEVEMLLESYHKITDEIVQVAGNLVSNIRNTEDIVNIILDANRNSLMLLDLKFSIGTLGIGSGAFVASLYGMNLKNFIEESDFAFVGVSTWAFTFAAIICLYGLHKLRRTQRLTMWGEGGKGRTGWMSALGPGGGPIPPATGSKLQINQALRQDRDIRIAAAYGNPNIKPNQTPGLALLPFKKAEK